MKMNSYVAGAMLAAASGGLVGNQLSSDRPEQIRSEIDQIYATQIPQAEVDLDRANVAWVSAEAMLGTACVASIYPFLPGQESEFAHKTQAINSVIEADKCGDTDRSIAAYETLHDRATTAFNKNAELENLHDYEEHLREVVLPKAEEQARYDKIFLSTTGAILGVSALTGVGLHLSNSRKDEPSQENILLA